MSENDATHEQSSGRAYTCAMCGGTFEPEWSDEEAIAEMATLFPGVSRDDCDVVCDDCFQKIKPSRPMERHEYE